jgi:protein-disulfide isomerase
MLKKMLLVSALSVSMLTVSAETETKKNQPSPNASPKAQQNVSKNNSANVLNSEMRQTAATNIADKKKKVQAKISTIKATPEAARSTEQKQRIEKLNQRLVKLTEKESKIKDAKISKN